MLFGEGIPNATFLAKTTFFGEVFGEDTKDEACFVSGPLEFEDENTNATFSPGVASFEEDPNCKLTFLSVLLLFKGVFPMTVISLGLDCLGGDPNGETTCLPGSLVTDFRSPIFPSLLDIAFLGEDPNGENDCLPVPLISGCGTPNLTSLLRITFFGEDPKDEGKGLLEIMLLEFEANGEATCLLNPPFFEFEPACFKEGEANAETGCLGKALNFEEEFNGESNCLPNLEVGTSHPTCFFKIGFLVEDPKVDSDCFLEKLLFEVAPNCEGSLPLELVFFVGAIPDLNSLTKVSVFEED
mmetsp:Transcript_19779/g.46262  ORF Transcript_19779/g.46262 Transcript_19779/m.46262 type:complete len:298 (-) Transcript_19779:3351-4244(-)